MGIQASFPLLLDIAKAGPLTLFATKPDYEKSYMQMLEQVAQEDCFSTLNGLDLQRDIIDRQAHAVIDTCGLSPPWVNLLHSDTLVSQLIVGRQHAFRKQDRIDTFLICDEADTQVTARSELSFPEGSLIPTAQTEKQLREVGVAQGLALSALGPVSRQVVTNMVNIFLFRVGDADSLLEARRNLLLSPGAEAILPSLEDGECLLRTNNGWPHAVLGKLDYVPPSRLSRPDRFDQHPFIPSRPLSDLPHVQAELKKLIAAHNLKAGRGKAKARSMSKEAHTSRPSQRTHTRRPTYSGGTE